MGPIRVPRRAVGVFVCLVWHVSCLGSAGMGLAFADLARSLLVLRNLARLLLLSCWHASCFLSLSGTLLACLVLACFLLSLPLARFLLVARLLLRVCGCACWRACRGCAGGGALCAPDGSSWPSAALPSASKEPPGTHTATPVLWALLGPPSGLPDGCDLARLLLRAPACARRSRRAAKHCTSVQY